jgi:hypothetical protein
LHLPRNRFVLMTETVEEPTPAATWIPAPVSDAQCHGTNPMPWPAASMAVKTGEPACATPILSMKARKSFSWISCATRTGLYARRKGRGALRRLLTPIRGITTGFLKIQ